MYLHGAISLLSAYICILTHFCNSKLVTSHWYFEIEGIIPCKWGKSTLSTQELAVNYLPATTAQGRYICTACDTAT